MNLSKIAEREVIIYTLNSVDTDISYFDVSYLDSWERVYENLKTTFNNPFLKDFTNKFRELAKNILDLSTHKTLKLLSAFKVCTKLDKEKNPYSVIVCSENFKLFVSEVRSLINRSNSHILSGLKNFFSYDTFIRTNWFKFARKGKEYIDLIWSKVSSKFNNKWQHKANLTYKRTLDEICNGNFNRKPLVISLLSNNKPDKITTENQLIEWVNKLAKKFCPIQKLDNRTSNDFFNAFRTLLNNTPLSFSKFNELTNLIFIDVTLNNVFHSLGFYTTDKDLIQKTKDKLNGEYAGIDMDNFFEDE